MSFTQVSANRCKGYSLIADDDDDEDAVSGRNHGPLQAIVS